MFLFPDPIVRMLIRSLYSEQWPSDLEVLNSPFSESRERNGCQQARALFLTASREVVTV